MNNRELAQLAKQTCTDRELDVLAMHWAGHSQRHISTALGISRTTVRDRIDNANRKIQAELKRQHRSARKDTAA